MAPLTSLKVALLLLCLGISGSAHAEVARVHSGESIESAVDHARAGDTIVVEGGRYDDVHVVIDKPISLIGVDRPTLSGALRGDVIRIKSPDVTVRGLIVTDSGSDLTAQNAAVYVQPGSDRLRVEACVIAYSLFGLWVERSNDVRVVGNNITGKRDFPSAQRGNGIQLYNSMGAVIADNQISFTRDGIYVDVSHHAVFRGNRIHNVRYGTHYMNSYFNVWEDNESFHNRGGLALMETRNQIVRNNRAWGNSDHGIMLRTIQDSVIENNVVAGNQRGFFIYDAEYNTIKDNLVVDNFVGVHIWAGSIHNDVDGNDFISNREQVRYVAARDEAWGKHAGNYWSNYIGWDRDGDGRGDVEYSANDVVDRLVWRLPVIKVLMNSPAIQTLRLISQQFPILRVPSILDPKPRMAPQHADWRQWIGHQGH